MNLRIPRSIHCAAAVALLALLYPSNARAVGVPTYDRINITTVGVGSPPVYAIPNDGVDDKPQIDLALQLGRSIYFPPGTFNYNGRMSLPTNKSYRLYGDGPGVSTIIFTGSTAGIYAPDIGIHELNVEGLTLMANSAGGGFSAGIWAVFGPNYANGSSQFRTAAIHNVQIVGSTRDGGSGGYWNIGIYLWKAQNAVIDKVEIHGNRDVTANGIFWDSSTDEATTGLNASNLQIKWCNSAFRTNGHTEGIYMNGFEFTSCGRAGATAVNLYANPRGGAVHLVNGKIDSVGSGLAVTDQHTIKLSNIYFTHTGSEAVNGTMLYVVKTNPDPLTTLFDVMITDCSFYGVSPNTVDLENGILLDNTRSVRIAGNNFTHMQPRVNGSCIGILSNNSVIRITDNLFGDDVRQKVQNQMPPNPDDPFYGDGNFPALP